MALMTILTDLLLLYSGLVVRSVTTTSYLESKILLIFSPRSYQHTQKSYMEEYEITPNPLKTYVLLSNIKRWKILRIFEERYQGLSSGWKTLKQERDWLEAQDGTWTAGRCKHRRKHLALCLWEGSLYFTILKKQSPVITKEERKNTYKGF